MDYAAIAVAIGFAVFWYRGAETEKLSPLLWVGPSVGVSAAIIGLGGGAIAALIGQAVLFVAITLYRAFVVKDQDDT
ncbi:MAG: hypothetical protein D4R74_02775 [Betaproteobacteria bacterium]|nr:MAG: hypothetical protein D4R74_02775 [Betaproteobacteria bacterium]